MKRRTLTEKVGEVTGALVAIHRLGEKARRVDRVAQRLLRAKSYLAAAKLFREIAALQNGQALAAACAAAASVSAAAYCDFRAQAGVDFVNGQVSRRTAARQRRRK